MKILVLGLWHLGLVTSACLAELGHTVVCFDDEDTIGSIRAGSLPIDEPGLDDLFSKHLGSSITLTSIIPDSSAYDIAWLCYDTPVNEQDFADIEFVYARAHSLVDSLSTHTTVLVSSQLPVGSIASLSRYAHLKHPSLSITFSAIPENLRLGSAVSLFLDPDRIVIGIDNCLLRPQLLDIYKHLSDRVIFMSVTSAEMTKHAINSFLATSVSFANELAVLCESFGADAKEVETGLKSDCRIGTRAYLAPGLAYSGGTLARDIAYLRSYSPVDLQTPLLDGVIESNELHKMWLDRVIDEAISQVEEPCIGFCGLTYKPLTNTLRRSLAIPIIHRLTGRGLPVLAFDPSNPDLHQEFASDELSCSSLSYLMAHTNILVITTPWPEFRSITQFQDSLSAVNFIVDPHRILEPSDLPSHIAYRCVGLSQGSRK